MKRHPSWRGRSKITFIWINMILCIENSREFTRKLFKLLISAKLQVIRYANNEQFERETEKGIPFTIASKRIKQ